MFFSVVFYFLAGEDEECFIAKIRGVLQPRFNDRMLPIYLLCSKIILLQIYQKWVVPLKKLTNNKNLLTIYIYITLEHNLCIVSYDFEIICDWRFTPPFWTKNEEEFQRWFPIENGSKNPTLKDF